MRPKPASRPSPASSLISDDDPRWEPPRIILNAVEGWGKTTYGAHAPDPIIIMAPGETGYDTLLGCGRVPRCRRARPATWADLLTVTEALVSDSCKTVVYDALNGFERLCHEDVCRRDFGNNWGKGKEGFAHFGQGYTVAAMGWIRLLAAMDRVRARGKTIILLSHPRIKNNPNPMGSDFDCWAADCHERTWAATAKWSDAILFGRFQTLVDTDADGNAKGIGGTDRVLRCERCDSIVAKNRYGMPAELSIPNDPKLVWSTVWAAIKGEPK